MLLLKESIIPLLGRVKITTAIGESRERYSRCLILNGLIQFALEGNYGQDLTSDS